MFNFLENEGLKHYFGNIKIEGSPDYDGIESFIKHFKDTYNELIEGIIREETAMNERVRARMSDNRF